MPLFMDTHRLSDDATPEMIAHAHEADMAVQEKYGVRYTGYWYDADGRKVRCLVEGPSREACEAVHREAHGLVAEDIIEVMPTTVQAFLGQGTAAPQGEVLLPDGTRDAGVRVIVVTEIDNLSAVARRHGDAAALGLVEHHDRAVRSILAAHGGREVRHTGEGMMLSFVSSSAAVRFALRVQRDCEAPADGTAGDAGPSVRIGIAAGEPVTKDLDLFGVAVHQARALCRAARPGGVLVSGAVRDLSAGKGLTFATSPLTRLPGLDEPMEVAEALGDAAELEPSPLRQAWMAVSRVVTQLRQRKVFRVAAAYAAGLFVLLQVAELTFHSLGLTSGAFQVLLILGLAGFPVALTLAWVYEVTPDRRIRKTPD